MGESEIARAEAAEHKIKENATKQVKAAEAEAKDALATQKAAVARATQAVDTAKSEAQRAETKAAHQVTQARSIIQKSGKANFTLRSPAERKVFGVISASGYSLNDILIGIAV